jgi:hypothetical protein
MSETTSTSMESLMVSRFRELSEDGKRKLMDYMESLYRKEKSSLGTECSLSEQERESLDHLLKEVEEFSTEKATADAQKALRELCAGIFESEENLASNHDFFLYGAPKRK